MYLLSSELHISTAYCRDLNKIYRMDDEITNSGISDTITCSELDRRQYENDLELLRIELESKKLELETNKGSGQDFS